jgi:hypothetical protein
MTAAPAPVAVVAAQGLPGAATLGPRPLDPEAFESLVTAVRDHRIGGLLVAAIESGHVAATDAQHQVAVRAHEDQLAADLLLERLLASASHRLATAAIEHRALKGPAVARVAYDDVSLRSFGDIDVLVDEQRFTDAIAVLTAGGARVRQGEPRPGFVARFGKGVCVVGDDGLELDVHRTLAEGPFGQATRPEEILADAPLPIVLGGTTVPAPACGWLFVHACYHVALGSIALRWSSLRDVAALCGRSELDTGWVVDTARRWHGRAVVATALELTAQHLPAPIDSDLMTWAEQYRPDSFERRALHVYRSAERSYAAQVAAGLFAVRGVRSRAAYVRALLLPHRSYLRGRDATYWRRARRGVSLVRRARRRP